ncbi:glycosyltransferase [Lacinutrix sp. Bg11-31]|uniref:glycosyltransferase n=1 Tax=Lacinutrix sp. Bg11-31 TaxID=2057808 RepID=UPI000C308CD1|nr:glycosyltransferase [Lacinutrix sp. Bg11-31]AUC82946.1 hypothetical protein CW733_12750 [Lacinutrix sp. Bg11-31]
MDFVFLINRLGMGGAERVVVTLANKLIESHYKVEIICLEKSDIAYNLNDKCKVSTLTNYNINNGVLKLFLLIYQAWKLRRHISKHKIKSVQSHLYRANYVNVLAKVLFFSKHQSQIVNHSSISRYRKEGAVGRLNLFLIKNLYSRSNIIVAISKMMAHEIKAITKREDILIINNPHDLEGIKSKIDKEINNFIFKKNITYIICIGRLIPLKRNQDVIKALAQIDKNSELIFLGEGDEKEKLINLSKNLKIEERVHFLGNVENPFKYLNKSDIFVCCSETEGFPNVLIEAMACETFVISSDCVSGPREIIAPQTNYLDTLETRSSYSKDNYGILYPVGDYLSLKEAILEVKGSRIYKKNVEENAFEAIRKYDLENIFEDYKTKLFNF